MKKSVEGCGFVCIDYIQYDGSVICDIGGTCGNVLSFLCFLGWESCVWMPWYEEESLAHWLNDRGVDARYFVKTKKCVPKIVQVTDRTDKTHRFLTRCPKCGGRLAEICLPTKKHMETDKEVSNLFFCDRISEGILNRAAETALAGGVTMYEPNGLRTYGQLLANSRKFHIVKFSDEKISEKWQQNLLIDLKNEGVKLIIVTQGKDGLKFAVKQNWGWTELRGEKADRGEGKDSSGAGDWLTAIFLDCFLSQIENGGSAFDYDIVCASLRCAMKAAALSCKEVGAQGMLHSGKRIKELERIIGMPLSSEKPVRRTYGKIVCPHCGQEIML